MSLALLCLGQTQQDSGIFILITDGILERRSGAVALIELQVAHAQLESEFPPEPGIFLAVIAVVEFAIDSSRVKVLAAVVGFIGVLELGTLA